MDWLEEKSTGETMVFTPQKKGRVNCRIIQFLEYLVAYLG